MGQKLLSLLLYKKQSCAVSCNGWKTKQFRTFSGVKQGDPISSILFVHVIEVLSILLNNHDEIEALTINNVRKLVGQFADDIWNVVGASPTLLKAVFQVYDLFYHISGLRINYDKTEIMRIGSFVKSDAQDYSMFQLKWTSGPVKILGIDIYNDSTQTAHKNFEIFKQKLSERLLSWKHRGLLLLGKVLVINSLLVSQMVYKMLMICSLDEEQYQQLKRVITKFLWDGGKSKIAYDKLILDYKDGGLKLHDINIKDKSIKML